MSIVNSQIYSNTASYVRAHLQKFPSPPWKLLLTCFALCLQGGGVFVQIATVTISSCTISGNTARSYVRVHAQEYPLPQ